MSVYQRTALAATICLVISLGVAACGKPKQVAQTPPPPIPPAAPAAPPAPPPPPAAPAPAATPRALTEDQRFAQMTLADVNKELGDVFFDLDASTIKDEGRTTLTTNANYLKRWTSVRVTVEGHCDERGTAEYNLALGDRRANSVKAYLVSLGVPAANITVVSKGKEAPVCTEHAESCWSQNRRGHFVVTAK
jgi:peptidoglycan-associated lipoprotein